MSRVAAVLIVVMAGVAACSGSSASELSTDSASGAPPGTSAPVLQVRPVLDIYQPSDDAPNITCGGIPAQPCTASLLGQDEVVLRTPADGLTYRLGTIVVGDADVESADAVTHLVNSEPAWQINIVLTAAAKGRFAEVSSGIVGQQIAVVVDGVVVSAPRVEEPITGGVLAVAGDFTKEQAERVASAISP